jgi:CubicO group peptidase (beta-lactamase class C family)
MIFAPSRQRILFAIARPAGRLLSCLPLLALAVNLASGDANTDQVDRLFADFEKPGSPGCAVGIIRDGKLVYKRGYGAADLEHDIPNSSGSLFYLCSVSKQFTAMSALLLASEGKISLQDSVRRYVPELPPYTAPVTIRHLLHHTSGIRDYLGLFDLAGKPDNYYTSDAEVLALLGRQKALDFSPGEEYHYSNSGYFLLSVIVRRASGRPLRDFAREHIFEPLGMTNTRYSDDHSAILKNRAVGYSWRNNEFKIDAATLDVVGSGGVFSTVEDLFLWDQNFYTGKVGGKRLIEMMQTAGTLNGNRPIAYAYGLTVGKYRGLKIVGHSGSLRGYRTEMIRFPEQRFSVICLCNTSTANPGRIARRIADIYLAGRLGPEDHAEAPPHSSSMEAAQRGPAAPPQAGDLTAYEGRYFSPELDARCRIAVEGAKLSFIRAYTAPHSLEPAEKDRFAAGGLRLEFARDAAGRVTGFDLSAGRVRNIHFDRIR